ncbi:uncharacterized protein LOC129909487 [Episyrphus balteatus]|uniref:uncharacterized protein LOC129909487 n=1 Tax=Episyrphus balteatus TaxID=286459 RepID=UPI00248517D6|nr:uncharacterized protein LOC129909487 [Episyrphus balteatus]
MLYIGIVIVSCITVVKSAIFFPSNSAYGIFAALAVPLDLGPHRNVFISYNFEANYNLPVNWQLPAYLEFGDTRRIKDSNRDEYLMETNATKNVKHMKLKTTKQNTQKNVKSDKLTDHNVIEENVIEITEASNDSISSSNNASLTLNATIAEENESENDINRERRSLLSRRTFYSMLKQRLEMHGYNGQGCLLRLICETNASGIGEINGFLGSVMHIIFAPSSSKDEQLSNAYYKAEFNGQQSQCKRYWKKCPHNILDFISTPVYDIINSLKTR